MAYQYTDAFTPDWKLWGATLQTIIPSQLRTKPQPVYERFECTLRDGDFIDIDAVNRSKEQLIILCHGLEGSSDSQYIRGMTVRMTALGYSVWALNYRGCSGRPNRLPQAYHSGKTDDLHDVVRLAKQKGFNQVVLIGFSLGGNLVLRYAGEQSSAIDSVIKGVMSISTPCDLASSSTVLSKRSNWIYEQRFLRKLKAKIEAKETILAKQGYYLKDFDNLQSLADFDDWFTAPVHGFVDAADYYAQCSCKPVIKDIAVKSLLLTAEDDPFLHRDCFPIKEAEDHRFFDFQLNRRGGHVGFCSSWSRDNFYSESRAMRFVNEVFE